MSTPDTPRDPVASASPRQPGEWVASVEPIASTEQFQAFADRTEEEDARAGEQLAGPDIPDVIPEDSPVPDAAFGEEVAFGAEPAAFVAEPVLADPEPAAFGAEHDEAAVPSTPYPPDGAAAVGTKPTELPPVRTDRGRALLLATAVLVLVVLAVVLLILLL